MGKISASQIVSTDSSISQLFFSNHVVNSMRSGVISTQVVKLTNVIGIVGD